MSLTQHIALWVMGLMLIGIIALAGLWPGRPGSELETSPTTFQEVGAILDGSSRKTDLQRSFLLDDLTGKRVHWVGWVGGVENSNLSLAGVLVSLWPEPVRLRWYGSLEKFELDYETAGEYNADLYFSDWYKPALLELKVGQKIQVSCVFGRHVGGTTVVLNRCELLFVADLDLTEEPEDDTAEPRDTDPTEGLDREKRHGPPAGTVGA